MKRFIVAVALVACGSSTPKPEPAPSVAPPATQLAPVIPEGEPECVDDKDEPVECESDKDCCPGFVCGLDPEGSYRVKVCIWAGK